MKRATAFGDGLERRDLFGLGTAAGLGSVLDLPAILTPEGWPVNIVNNDKVIAGLT